MLFKYNDGGRSNYFKATGVGDCCTRAIAIATGKDYKEVYNDLKKLNKGQSCRNGTPNRVWKKYLESLGWYPLKGIMGAGTGIQYHVCSRDLEYLNQEYPVMIIRVSKHLTTVKDHMLQDTFDCSRGGERGIYQVWVPSK